jgi:SAM-dependent methyltransferase
MAQNPLDYREIIAHYEDCLARYGDSHRGVDWPNPEDADKRYQVMLELISRRPQREEVSLLDFGCGSSHLFEYMQKRQLTGITYSGLDLSPQFVSLSQSKYPANPYWCLDLLNSPPEALPKFDYVVMNGVFTEKRALSFDAMQAYFERLVSRVFEHAREGIAFNVMSKQVDWERDDLFHLPLDTLADFLTKRLTRNFVIRNDYGLFEYTVYVYREAMGWQK